MIKHLVLCLSLAAVALSGCKKAAQPTPAWANPTKGYASTVQPLATDAALESFASGGNAIDAAVAAALTLGVVDGHDSGIGGGCFMLIHLADGRNICIDGREIGPAAATRDMYFRDGKADSNLSQTGPLASGVPGALAAYAYAVENFGKLPLSAGFYAGIKHAEKGFPIDEVYARKLAATAKDLALYPASKAIFLKPDGTPYQKGDILVQTDLAESYRSISAQGPSWFYQGPYAEAVGQYMKENGGILTAKDFADYKIKLHEPLISTYRGFTIIGFPPPSSGGVHIAEMLNILENFDLKQNPAGSAETLHTITEAMKLAFADRAYWLGDPDFVHVPTGLFDKEYAKSLAAKIDPTKSTPVPTHGDPPNWQNNFFEKHTTHFATADAYGNWVACTATINTAFGSKVVVPGTGILLNNEMDDFAIAVGVPNHFKLVGGEANSVAAGKRPLSSMSPTIVMKDGKVVFSVGAAGGPTIISQTLLGIINQIDYGMTPAEALAAPRIHDQWSPDQLKIEKGVPPEVRAKLKDMGYTLDEVERFGACQIVAEDSKGNFSGASDPRVPGLAAPSR